MHKQLKQEDPNQPTKTHRRRRRRRRMRHSHRELIIQYQYHIRWKEVGSDKWLFARTTMHAYTYDKKLVHYMKPIWTQYDIIAGGLRISVNYKRYI